MTAIAKESWCNYRERAVVLARRTTEVEWIGNVLDGDRETVLPGKWIVQKSGGEEYQLTDDEFRVRFIVVGADDDE